MQILNSNTTIICPCNDGESLLIIEIARKLAFDVRVSNQGWGAVLSSEPAEIFSDLKKNVIIIEIPGIEKEEELRKGHKLFIIDHHKYPELDRSNPKSSLEQFSDLIEYKLNRWETGIALNDSGYIYALKKNSFSDEEIRKIREFDLSAQGYKTGDFEELSRDYYKGYPFGKGFYVVETHNGKTSYLADLHFLENEKQKKSVDLIVFVNNPNDQVEEINFFGSPAIARVLQKKMGGYCGGDEEKSMFWGVELSTPTSKGDLLSSINLLR